MSESYLEKILVQVNFNDTSMFAIQHAIEIAINSRKELNLLHIVNIKKENVLFPIEKAKIMMQDLINQLSQTCPVKINGFVMEGNPFKLINSIAEKTGSALVIIGLQENQKVNLPMLKMIYPSRIPYLLVRQKPINNGYLNILFPIDPSHQTKEKVFWGVFFSKFFGSTLHIMLAKPNNKDIDRPLQNNMIFAKSVFNDFKVNYKMHVLPGNGFDIHALSPALTNELNAGLMIMMTTKHFGIFDYILGPHEQKIINTNKNIPIMFVNSRDDLYVPCI